MRLSVVVLTFNSTRTISTTLESAQAVADEIFVVDSYSTDDTLALVKPYTPNIVQHPFENYGVQRNWAMRELPITGDWQLHLDADERLTPELSAEIKTLKASDPAAETEGYYIARLVHFMDRPIRHGGMFPIWHMRLFRTGKGACENRRYDQHFLVQGQTQRLKHPMIDDIRINLSDWTARHNRWSDSEVSELLSKRDPNDLRVEGSWTGGPVKRKRAQRDIYNLLPKFWRAFGIWVYRYFIKFGFLDGKEGLIFFFLQTFWFRFIVDAKLYEARNGSESGKQ